MRGRETETWVYVRYESAYPGGYPYGYPYGPYRFGGYGYRRLRLWLWGCSACASRQSVYLLWRSILRSVLLSWYIPPSVPVPYKTVTFSNGRVVSFQYLMNPHR